MVPQRLFTGTATALVTPFTEEGTYDEPAFRRLIDFQIEGGVESLLVLGTTGENPTISNQEREHIVETAIEQVGARVPVIVGTGSNATSQSVQFARQAAAAGANAQLVVGPYYNKPSQAGFRAHVAAIADATDCPIILYNVPGRTCLNITAETTLRLSEDIPTVIGIKEASGNLQQITDILSQRPSSLAVYAGDDEMTLPLAALGADGAVSVISNALPRLFGDMTRLALAGDMTGARDLHFRLLMAMRACFLETNPIPIKTILGKMGLINPFVRLPLLPISTENRWRLLDSFADLITVFA